MYSFENYPLTIARNVELDADLHVTDVIIDIVLFFRQVYWKCGDTMRI